MPSPIPHFGAAISSIITIIIFVALSAISSWVQKREERNKAPGPPRPKGVITPLPRRPGVPPLMGDEHEPPTMDDWEKQIRRWVGEPEPVESIPTPPPTKPAPVAAPVTRKLPPEIKPRRVGPDLQLKKLTASAAAYKEGEQLPGAIARTMKGIDTLTMTHPPLAPSKLSGRRSTAAAAAISQIKHHQTVRQALVASIILGQPKSFEQA